jgi:hypothetical protein
MSISQLETIVIAAGLPLLLGIGCVMLITVLRIIAKDNKEGE